MGVGFISFKLAPRAREMTAKSCFKNSYYSLLQVVSTEDGSIAAWWADESWGPAFILFLAPTLDCFWRLCACFCSWMRRTKRFRSSSRRRVFSSSLKLPVKLASQVARSLSTACCSPLFSLQADGCFVGIVWLHNSYGKSRLIGCEQSYGPVGKNVTLTMS